VGNYWYVASARRGARRWGARGGGEGRGHIVSPCTQFVHKSFHPVSQANGHVDSIYIFALREQHFRCQCNW